MAQTLATTDLHPKHLKYKARLNSGKVQPQFHYVELLILLS